MPVLFQLSVSKDLKKKTQVCIMSLDPSYSLCKYKAWD